MAAPAPGRPSEPGYRRLARLLREQVLAGDFADGAALPTELGLAQQHRLSRQTVRRAYLDLVAEGLVYRVAGRGTFATPEGSRYRRRFGSVDDLMNLTLDTEMEILRPLGGSYDASAAQRLGLTGRSLYSVTFSRSHLGSTFCRTQVFLPPSVGAALEQDTPLLRAGERSRETVIGLIEAGGTAIQEAEQAISAVPATARPAAVLGCAVGAPLLHIERLYLDGSGRPVELAVSDFLPEHYTHRLRLSRGIAAASPRILPTPTPDQRSST